MTFCEYMLSDGDVLCLRRRVEEEKNKKKKKEKKIKIINHTSQY